MRVLGRSFYARPTVEVARALLGKVIKHQTHVARIVETEAYLGIDDAAAHAAAGVTPRTRVIFGPPGHAYVYLIYGIHNCLNIVAEPEGTAGCVLIRAVEPIAGIELASNGPGRLTRALGITLRHNGCDVTHGPIVIGEEDAEERKNLPTLHTRGRAKSFAIGVSPRIGITKSADLPLRFFILENRYVSRRG